MTTKTERNHSYSSQYKDTRWQDIGTSQSELTKFFLLLSAVCLSQHKHISTDQQRESTYSMQKVFFLFVFNHNPFLWFYCFISCWIFFLSFLFLVFVFVCSSIVSNKDNDIFSLTIPEGVTAVVRSKKKILLCMKQHKASNVKDFFLFSK